MALSRRRTEMASKKHRPEEAVAKLRQADVLVSQGQSVAEAIRAIGVTEVTYYRWRREFGGLKADQVKRLKALEAENARLRRAVSDLTLDKQILAEAARGPRRRGAAHGRHHRAGAAVRPLRVSEGRGPAARRGLAGQRQAGGADLEARRAEGAAAPARARAAVAGRRLVCPAQAGASQPRLELRLRRGPHPRRAQVQAAERH